MDKLKRDTPLIILDKFCAICMMTPVLWSLSFAAGETYVPVELMVRDEPIRNKASSYLTGRERDVLNGLLAGQSNKEIARVHNLSEVTIKHHLKSLRAKLGARNRTHAVCRAVELGIAEDDMALA